MKVHKMFWGVLTAVILLALLPSDKMGAEELAQSVAEEDRTGYQSMKEIRVKKDVGMVLNKPYAYSVTDEAYWGQFCSDYFYNRMNSEEKALYNAMYANCMKYLTTNADMDGGTDWIYAGSLSEDRAMTVVQIFQMENPQFYFISNSVGTGYFWEQDPTIALGCYPEFEDGATRAFYTAQLKSTVNAMMNQINAQPTVLAREKKAHDIIVSKVDYDHYYYDPYLSLSRWNQSCASVFFEDYTVCAGYAEAFTLLCNGAGMNTISVTSSDHEWNQIQLYGKWYVVDCTWDDDYGSYWGYDYFNVSSERVNDGHHSLESIWNGMGVPVCNSDTVSTTSYNGVDYEAVFDAEYYLNRYSDLKSAFGENHEQAFHHFVTQGMKEGRQGCAAFDVNSYRNQYVDLRQAYRNDLPKYYLHYITTGKREGRKGTGCTYLKNPVTTYKGVNYSTVYDFVVYTGTNSDINRLYGNDDIGALEHFVNYGMKEGRRANLEFNVVSYRNQYADLRRAYGSNLKSYYMHYVNAGKREGRKGYGCDTLQNAVTKYNGIDYSAVYDYNYYTTKYPNIKNAYGFDDTAVLKYFVETGMKLGHQGCAAFDVMSYRNQYADLRQAFGTNWKLYYLHYISNGRREGRKGTGCDTLQNAVTKYNGVDYSAIYNYNYYVTTYPDIKKAYGSNDAAVLAHFVNYGMGEGRQGCASFNVWNYRNQYADLRNAYGSNWKAYYLHYLNYGRFEGRAA